MDYALLTLNNKNNGFELSIPLFLEQDLELAKRQEQGSTVTASKRSLKHEHSLSSNKLNHEQDSYTASQGDADSSVKEINSSAKSQYKSQFYVEKHDFKQDIKEQDLKPWIEATTAPQSSYNTQEQPSETPFYSLYEREYKVYEDNQYSIRLSLYKLSSLMQNLSDRLSFQLFVNDCDMGQLYPNSNGSVYFWSGRPNCIDIIKYKPFFLFYDQVVIRVTALANDFNYFTLVSPKLLCQSSNSDINDNIKDIINKLNSDNNQDIIELMFNYRKDSQGSNNHSFNLNSFSACLEEIISCYESNLVSFKTQAKYHLSSNYQLTLPKKISAITPISLQYLTQNLSILARTRGHALNQSQSQVVLCQAKPCQGSGLALSKAQGQNHGNNHSQCLEYLNSSSKQILALCKVKDFKTKENLQIWAFLARLEHHIIKAIKKLKELLASSLDQDQNTVLSSSKDQRANGAYYEQLNKLSSNLNLLFSIERINKEHIDRHIAKLNGYFKQVKRLKHLYGTIFGLDEHSKIALAKSVYSLPECSHVYEQVMPYKQIYSCMKNYFKYQGFSIDKERLLLSAKTLDSLFEYYCLYSLINMLLKNGFEADSSQQYYYLVNIAKNNADLPIANTYYFSKGQYKVTLYYQSIVSGCYFENDNMLFRTSANDSGLSNEGVDYNYYNPDFVLKISSAQDSDYIIMDAKYSTFDNIAKHYLSELIIKYVINMAVLDYKTADIHTNNTAKQAGNEIFLNHLLGQELKAKAPKILYALQGKIYKNESVSEIDSINLNFNNIWHYHQSPLAKLINPPTKIGIIEINAKHNNEDQLWKEICSVVPELNT